MDFARDFARGNFWRFPRSTGVPRFQPRDTAVIKSPPKTVKATLAITEFEFCVGSELHFFHGLPAVLSDVLSAPRVFSIFHHSGVDVFS